MKRDRVILVLLAFFSSLFLTSLIFAQGYQTGIEFTTGTYTCEKTSINATWVKSDTNQRWTVPSQANCSAYSHETVASCCPGSLTCNTSSGLCVDSSKITDCTKYPSKGDCEADDQNVGIVSIANSSSCGLSNHFNQGSETCLNQTRCGCVWEKSNCSAKKMYTTECSGGSTLGLGNCTWSTFSITNEDCSNGDSPIVITSTASWQQGSMARPADCSNVTRDYPCVSTAKLPFFTLTNFVISLISVIFVYLFLSGIKKR